MRTWQRRTLGILELGGGAVGFAVGSGFLLGQGALLVKLLMLPFIGLYVWGIWLGLRVIEGASQWQRQRLFWLLQVPYVMSPFFGVSFASGLLLLAQLQAWPMKLTGSFRLGSQFDFSLMQPEKPFIIGLNLFALAVVLFLSRTIHVARGQAAPLPLEGARVPALEGGAGAAMP